MIAAGTHKARAVAGALGETKGGAEQVGVEFEILEGEDQGAHITWFGYFTEKAFERTIKALRTCGWTGDDLSDLSGITTNEVALVVDHEQYEGKVSAKVQWVNSLGGLALKSPLTPDKAKAFAARMRGQVIAISRSNGTGKAISHHPAHVETPMPRDEDMPEWAK